MKKLTNDKDLFNVFGMGVSLYLKLLRNLIRSFFVITLLSLVIILNNKSQKPQFDDYNESSSVATDYMIGNLGFAFTFCG
jgi:hypothetical protein